METQRESGLLVAHRSVVSRSDHVTATAADVVDGPPPLRPQRFAGWPPEWAPPLWSRSSTFGASNGSWWGRVEQLTDTAWMCLDRNASVIATMPPYLVGSSPSLNAGWLNNPDPLVYGSWFEFAKQLMWDYQLGEVYVLATAWYESTGYPARFHVVPPWEVTSDFDQFGLRRHRIGQLDVTGIILHVPYQIRVDEAHGHGPLEVGMGRIIAANALARYATDLAASGGIPSSVLIHPDNLDADQAADLQMAWVTSRMASMGLPAVLSGGIDFKVLSLDPEKMALVDLSRFNEARIAYLLGVPAPLVGLPSGQDSMHYDNQLMAREDHWQSGLKPKVTAVMQAISNWALPRGTSIEVNRDEYVKPPLLERAQAWAIFIDKGVVTTDEVRQAERYGNATPSDTLTSGVLQ